MTPMKRHPGQLPIRARRILSSVEGVSVEPIVYCPRQERTMSLEECADCEDYIGISIDTRGGESVLRCRSDSATSDTDTDAGDDARASDRPTARPWSVAPPNARPSHAGRTPVSAVMCSDVICVRSDLTVEMVASLLLDQSISGAPVVDREGHLIGVVSKTDLLRHQYPAHRDLPCGPDTRIGDLVAQPSTICLTESASLAQAAAVMAFEGIHRIPVVSCDGKVVGIVSSIDVLEWLARENGYVLPD